MGSMPRTILVLLVTGIVSAYSLDGVVSQGEYSFSKDLGKIMFYANDNGDSLNLAIVTDYDGWAAMGLGSDRMDGAYILMGYVKDGQPFFSQQMGHGHGHSAVDSPLNIQYVRVLLYLQQQGTPRSGKYWNITI